MTIDTTTVNLYTCCKCKHQWTNWDSKQCKDGPVPKNCPSCRNIRWNRYYADAEIELIVKLHKQAYIGWIPDDSRYNREKKLYLYDFITYDFLRKIKPQPTMIELKQVLAVPIKSKLEQRHELMISIIRDRIENRQTYLKEQPCEFDGEGGGSSWIDKESLASFELYKDFTYPRRAVMKGCKHTDLSEVKQTFYDEYDRNRWNEDFQLKEFNYKCQ